MNPPLKSVAASTGAVSKESRIATPCKRRRLPAHLCCFEENCLGAGPPSENCALLADQNEGFDERRTSEDGILIATIPGRNVESHCVAFGTMKPPGGFTRTISCAMEALTRQLTCAICSIPCSWVSSFERDRNGIRQSYRNCCRSKSVFGGPSLRQTLHFVSEQGGIFTWGPTPRQFSFGSNTGAQESGAFTRVWRSRLFAHRAGAGAHGFQWWIHRDLPSRICLALPVHLPISNCRGLRSFRNSGNCTTGLRDYALQDAAKHDPVVGAGNGNRQYLRYGWQFRAAIRHRRNSDGPLGITRLAANFGPFSNDILMATSAMWNDQRV